MVRPGLVALTCALATAAAAPRADAAMPRPSAKFAAHEHSTPGDEWHIELTVSSDPRRVRQLVLHEGRCGATVLTANVTIRPDGTIASAKLFTSRGRPGRWELTARFTDPTHLEGTFRVTAGGCEGAVRRFEAHAGGHHGGGGGGHSHHHQHLYGTRPGHYPDLSRATRARRAQARRLWKASRRTSRTRFATYGRAWRLGFRPAPGWPSRRPQLFHLRHTGYAAAPGSFDAWRPESLVYWNPLRGRPVLIAYMYRLAPGPRPRFAAPLLGWHSHGVGRSQMTHVWLTGSLRTALANCMPVAALEAALPRYRYDPAGRPGSPESTPCPQEATS